MNCNSPATVSRCRRGFSPSPESARRTWDTACVSSSPSATPLDGRREGLVTHIALGVSSEGLGGVEVKRARICAPPRELAGELLD